MGEIAMDSEAPESGPRVVKRYSNRKLYDTKESRYVTLLQIAALVRLGEDVRVIDNATKEDKTDVTFALIISEELKLHPRAIPLGTLRELIRGEAVPEAEAPLGYLSPLSGEMVARTGVADCQPDESRALESEIRQLRQRIAELEAVTPESQVLAAAR